MPINQVTIMHKSLVFSSPQHNGFTLIEVLVAMLVLAVGLLGLAGLQAHALKNNQSAYYRSQATQLAYDIADRMRANQIEAKNFATSQYDSDVLAPADATNQANCKTTTGCTPAQMAEQDLYDWQQNLKEWLPLGTGSINAVDPIITVTINWDDNHDGAVDSDDPNFTMSFQL
jgi:type IV pilus assembly protein PilV